MCVCISWSALHFCAGVCVLAITAGFKTECHSLQSGMWLCLGSLFSPIRNWRERLRQGQGPNTQHGKKLEALCVRERETEIERKRLIVCLCMWSLLMKNALGTFGVWDVSPWGRVVFLWRINGGFCTCPVLVIHSKSLWIYPSIFPLLFLGHKTSSFIHPRMLSEIERIFQVCFSAVHWLFILSVIWSIIQILVFLIIWNKSNHIYALLLHLLVQI